jgi:hypothetical protein
MGRETRTSGSTHMAHRRNVQDSNVSPINGSRSLWLAQTLERYEVEEIDIRQLARYLAMQSIPEDPTPKTGTYGD